MLPRAALKRPSIGAGTALALAAVILLLILWGSVLIGSRVLIGTDILYGLPPWSGAAGAYPPRNPIVSDPVLQMLPWQGLVREAFTHLRLPLWNPNALSGSPLLANDQSAAFSPFTWLALPFSPARGLSLAMLAKLAVAVIGMATFLRTLNARPVAAVLGGIVYAGSSYMIVWLAWPQSAVAALIPFAFACVEWQLQKGGTVPLVALALIIALQFFAGHAETSLHMGGALAIYALIRVLSLERLRLRRLVELTAAAAAGTLLAGIQLLPFAALLGRSSLSADRAAAGFGLAHLRLSDLSSWVVPNARGNPAIDGLLGRAPNYNESTGFASVSALVLAPIGLWRAWVGQRSIAIALGALGLLSAGVAYGPLTPLAGRLPGLSVSGNERLLAVLCLVVAASAGLGFDALLSWQVVRRAAFAPFLFALGLAALAGLAICAVLVLRLGGRVDQLLPAGPRGFIGFWIVVAALSLAAACSLVGSWINGYDRRIAGAALVAVVLGEVVIFGGPFNPRVPANQVPPASVAMNYLRTHQGLAAATGLRMAPESSTLYGVVDARGYDVVIDRRERAFWSAADPGYHDEALLTLLERPDPRFLAAAGVNLFMTASDAVIPGTNPVFVAEGVTIASVPGARPFAFLAPAAVTVDDIAQARSALSADPLGPVAVEHCCWAPANVTLGTGDGTVDLLRKEPGRVDLDVRAFNPATVVVLQSYDSGWVARIDGSRSRIDPADILFQAIQVPAGHHRLTLRYEPPSVVLGAVMSGVGWSAILVTLAAGQWARRRRR
jgi:hypothetical protein